jgi:hypothetical protein
MVVNNHTRKKHKAKKGMITLHNWWKEANTKTKKRTILFFETLLKDQMAKYKEIHIHSIFGDTWPQLKDKEDGVLYVQYSGEPVIKQNAIFDLNIVPHSESGKFLPIPHVFNQIFINKIPIESLTKRRTLVKDELSDKKFCLFSVSNPINKDRINFFKQLSKYKKVDSCGKVLNNLGYRCPGFHDNKEYHTFINQYKFMICFENTSMTNYITEKLLNAYTCGTIPIYWGCPNLGDYVNLDSILYLKAGYTKADVNDLISKIEKLDNDDELYKAKYESVFFKDGKIPDNFQLPIIRKKIDAILDKT